MGYFSVSSFQKPKITCEALKLHFLNPAQIEATKSFLKLDASLENSTCYSESVPGVFSFFRKLHVCVSEVCETQMGLQVTQEFCWRLKRCCHRPTHSLFCHRHRLSQTDFSWWPFQSLSEKLCEPMYLQKCQHLKMEFPSIWGCSLTSAQGLFARLMEQNHCKFLLTVS